MPAATAADYNPIASPPSKPSASSAVASAPAAASDGGLFPHVNLFLEPMDMSSNLTLSERASLVADSARPWREFFDYHAMSVPQLEVIKARVAHNIETYFYNYLICGLVYLALFLFARPVAVLAIVATVALAVWMYVINPGPIAVPRSEFVVEEKMKHGIMAVVALLAIFVFQAGGILLSAVIIMGLASLAHASFRDHTV
eukprot:CAMPEP_0184719552 /NCGR_PEP_ID=MMETSP0314-20130426/8835_1 /TAXON_ID=38298 /ORGANISM="Rhodella maculata, Strain CCMP 736" /LENGTH=199 /DNA_ID=CAMNT_0027183449 /DNA_START=19 /DNA_END=618 /DNA_ORIENTATION=+